MKKMLLALAMTTAFATAAWAQAKQDFTLVNATGYDIDEVYVSPSKANTWQEDVLGDDSDGLEDGASTHISFKGAGGGCIWDLKVVFEDDDEAVWNNIDLCKVSKITLHYDRKARTTTADID